MARIIDGKALAQKIKENISEEVSELKNKGIIPGLAVILVGDDPASKVYVNNKKKACAQVGIYSEEYLLPADTDEKTLLDLIAKLNADDRINGVLLHPAASRLQENIRNDKSDEGRRRVSSLQCRKNNDRRFRFRSLHSRGCR